MDRSKWRDVTRVNWSDNNIDCDAESRIQIVSFWCGLSQINLDLTSAERVCCLLFCGTKDAV